MTITTDDRNFVFAVVRRIVRCEHGADDATQDALLTALRHFEKFRGDSTFRTWLYRVAVTTALGYLRKQRRSREESVEDRVLPAKLLADPSSAPDEVAMQRQQLADARTRLAALRPIYRVVIELRCADHTEPEIARALGISVNNVKIRAHRARAQLAA
jgi:RNA polymerase sigma-70 factor, ECF subfamily